jgi:hypothetical protein
MDLTNMKGVYKLISMIHQFISRSEHPNFSILSSSIAHACHMQCLCKSDVDLELGEEKSLGAGPNSVLAWKGLWKQNQLKTNSGLDQDGSGTSSQRTLTLIYIYNTWTAFLLLDICSRISDPSCSPSPSSIYMILHVYIYRLSTRKKNRWCQVIQSSCVRPRHWWLVPAWRWWMIRMPALDKNWYTCHMIPKILENHRSQDFSLFI